MTPPPFGTFPKIHPFWKGKASLTHDTQSQAYIICGMLGCCIPGTFFSPDTFTRFTLVLHDFMRFLRNFTWFLHDFTRFLRNFTWFLHDLTRFLRFSRYFLPGKKFSIPGTKNYYAGLHQIGKQNMWILCFESSTWNMHILNLSHVI